jgi:glycosyltransferase involved in cell wall biosynthesis
MRILLLTPMPPAPSAPGAIPVLLYAQLIGLSERHAVTLVTVAGPEPHEFEAVRRVAAAGVEVHAIERHEPHGRARWARRRRFAGAWLQGRWPWRTVWFWQPGIQRLLDRLAGERSFDMVVAEDNAMGIYRVPNGAVRALTEYEVRRPRPIRRPPLSPRQWPRWAFGEADWHRWPRYERDIWRRFDLLQVFTDRDADAVRAMAPDLSERVHVNPFAIALPSQAETPVEPDSVVFLGNYTHPPNVHAALWLGREIMPRLRRLRPGVHLALAGAYAPAEVRALAAPDIRVLGYVPDAEALIRRNAVVMAPVRTGGGMRMKVLHAMALGKAVVTTPRGTEGLATGERVPPLVVADSEESMARLTAQLLADADAREQLGAAARRYVEEHHSPRAYASRLEDVYASAIDERRRSSPRVRSAGEARPNRGPPDPPSTGER